MRKIAIFASGTGSNAAQIVNYFADRTDVEVALIVSNRATAGVLDMAREQHIPTLLISRASFNDSRELLDELTARDIDFIVLAGFLWLIPPYLVEAYRGRMVNIHPALLPAYGGRGMYGSHIHQAVKAAGESESGITIHWVDDRYDEGHIILQVRCALSPDDTPEDIARKVLKLEHQYFSPTIDRLLQQHES